MSFRIRIFSISILTVSAVLAIVISLSWSRVMRLEQEQLDARLCMEAKRFLPRQVNAKRVSADSRLIDDLVDKLRISSQGQLMLLVESSRNGILIESSGADAQGVMSKFNWDESELPSLKGGERAHSPRPCQFISFEHQHEQWRATLFEAPYAQSFIAVEAAATTSELTDTFQTALTFIIPISLLLSALGAWFITTNTIRPINRLQMSMNQVTPKELSHRLPTQKEDKEFKVLIDAYNTMLNRLEKSFLQASRFTADAAHELKTPLTILRGKLEQAATSADPSQLDLNEVLDEVGHLSAITRKLLLLSQADAGSMALHYETINITNLLDELTTDMELVSETLALDCSVERGLALKGDLLLLKQLFNNLLTNAMRYGIQEKGITIQAQKLESGVEVRIRNSCSPMLSEVRERLFERFYRGDLQHRQGTMGSGLGLSLAREIARAHGGELTLEPSPNDVISILLHLPSVK